MARARSIKALRTDQAHAGKDYVGRIVFAVRAFELGPNRESAGALLDSLPTSEAQKLILLNMDGMICEGEVLADMTTLARTEERLARNFSRAVLIRPERLPSYSVICAE